MEQEILEIFRMIFNNEEINIHTKKEDIQNWDSMNHLRLIMEIEEVYAIELEPEDMVLMNSVQSVLSIVQTKK